MAASSRPFRKLTLLPWGKEEARVGSQLTLLLTGSQISHGKFDGMLFALHSFVRPDRFLKKSEDGLRIKSSSLHVHSFEKALYQFILSNVTAWKITDVIVFIRLCLCFIEHGSNFT